MKNLQSIVFAALILSGCATSSQTYTPDGRIGYSLNCSGLALNWGMCLEKAGNICGTKGYEIISASGDRGAIVNINDTNAFGGTTINRSMLVACKK